MRYRIGTSGWRYPSWRGDFYPDGLRQREELHYAAGLFTGLEINGSFYSLQRPSSYVRWHEETPKDFVFAVKGGRYITHMRRLAGVETALANFFASGVLALGAKTGPVLWQLPATIAYDRALIEAFLTLLPRTHGEAAALGARHDDKLRSERVDLTVRVERPLRHALEVRHPSFDCDDFGALLRDQAVACVLADSAGTWPAIDRVTTDFSYVRLHGAAELYASGYSPPELDRWAGLCRRRAESGDVHVYFDNDARGHAPHDAVSLLRRLDGPSPGTSPATDQDT